MGRNAGWLAAASTLTKSSDEEAPHLVYVPELVFDENAFLEEISTVHDRLNRVFVVVCEGIRYANGDFVGSNSMKETTDAFGHTLNTFTIGVAAYLAELVRQELHLRARFLRPVLIGRSLSACVSEVDRQEAYRVGQEAVRMMAGNQTGLMVTLNRVSTSPYLCEPGTAPLARVANAEKRMPLDFLDHITGLPNDKFKEYALPLIGEAGPPITRLQNHHVSPRTRV
jgi:ATP-dependent phosphofructokinase / diphosphate-dependent phosphofructokinase